MLIKKAARKFALNPESWTKNFRGFYMSKEKRNKHGYAEVLKYMHLIKSGRTFNSIHREYGVNEGRLKVLWERYQKKGPSGLRKMKNIKADFSLKKEIVLDIEKNHLTLHGASLKYGASPSRISVWLKKWLQNYKKLLNV